MKNMIILFLACYSMSVFGYTPLKDSPNWPTSRDKLEWPFSSDSHMNMPIGENAVYVDLQLTESHTFIVNYEHIINPSDTDPFFPYYACKDGSGKCFPPDGRCTGTVPVRTDGVPTNVQLPSNYIIPELGTCLSLPTGGVECNTDNPASWLVPGMNNDYMYSNGGTARCDAGGPIYGQLGNFAVNLEPIKGDAVSNFPGRYGGSAIHMRGLTIKEQDILSDSPIKHPLALWISPAITYYDPSGVNYRWPARTSDAAAWWSRNPDVQPGTYWDPTNLYSSTVPGFVMGALIALPLSMTPEDLGIKTELGLKFFHAAQDYGMYLVNSGGYSNNFQRTAMGITPEAGQAIIDRYGHPFTINITWPNNDIYAHPGTPWGDWADDINAIWTNLHLVDDNAENNVGGAGVRRTRPIAPPFQDDIAVFPPGAGTINNVIITP